MTFSIFPLLPPMKTCVGAGRSFNASGAFPAMIFAFVSANFRKFCSRSSTASGFFSIAKTFTESESPAHSTEIDPVPAPTS